MKRKGEFGAHADTRGRRLAEKMEKSTQKQEALKKEKEPAEDMEVEESKPAKKVSTSGWRDLRKQQFKQKQKEKKKTMKY